MKTKFIFDGKTKKLVLSDLKNTYSTNLISDVANDFSDEMKVEKNDSTSSKKKSITMIDINVLRGFIQKFVNLFY